MKNKYRIMLALTDTKNIISGIILIGVIAVVCLCLTMAVVEFDRYVDKYINKSTIEYNERNANVF